MNDNVKFMVQDENGSRNVAELLSCLSIDGIDYAIYKIDNEYDESLVLVGKIIKNEEGNNIIVSVDDKYIKEMLFKMVDRVIEEG